MPRPTVLGADPAHLDELAARFDAAARTVDRTAAHLDARVRATAWTGPEAARFRATWAASRAELRLAAESGRRAAAGLRRAAEEQRRASRAARHSARRAGPVLPRHPLHESVVSVRGSVQVGPVRVRPVWSARLTELERRRTRIVLSDAVGLAVGVGAGSLVEVGCSDLSATPVPSMSRRADLGAGAAVEHRTVLEVPDAQVHRTLVDIGIARAAALVGLGPLVALAGRGGPPPTGHEVLVHGEVAANSTVSVGGAFGPGAGATSRSDLAVGRGVDATGRPATVVELSTATSAAVHLGVLQRLGVHGPHVAERTWLRLEVPDHPTGSSAAPPVRIEVRTSGADGRTTRVVATASRAPGRGARAAVAALHLDLRAGRHPGPALVDRVLSGLVGTARLTGIRTEALVAETQACHADAVGGAVTTVGIGGAVEVVNVGPADE